MKLGRNCPTQGGLSRGVTKPSIKTVQRLHGSPLVAELSFGHGNIHDDHAKVGILTASLLGAGELNIRTRQYRLAEIEEQIDSDQDGIPDIYQQDTRSCPLCRSP